MDVAIDHTEYAMDVGAYALGLLSNEENDAFEAHLAICDECADELERLMPVTESLSRLDALQVAQITEAGPTKEAPVTQPRPRGLRLSFALAAGIVLMALAATLGVFVGMQTAPEDDTRAAPVDPAVELLRTGERFDTTDEVSGATAVVALDALGWGTRVALELTNIRGPLVCELVAVAQDGQRESAVTWQVPQAGYGTVEQPNPLRLEGGTSIQRDDLDAFEVRITEGPTAGEILAHVDVA